MTESASSHTVRPDFDNPPVIEVALSVGFEPLARYTNAHTGLFWQRVVGLFSAAEEHPPLSIPPARESLVPSPDQPEVEIGSGVPPTRTWLIARDGDELLQLQRDTFAHNWRKRRPEQPYPRYKSVRGHFEEHFRSFMTFVEEHDLGDVKPKRCDITYVNHIPLDDTVISFGDLHEAFSLCAWPKMVFLPKPDHARSSMQFVIRDDMDKFAGRLTVDVKPAYRRVDGRRVIVLTMTARGNPIGAGVGGTLAFFDLGREWIVRGFADLTTAPMHELWGRTR